MSHDYNEKAASYFATRRHEMLDFVPVGSKRVLELGCAEGDFGAELKKRDSSVVIGIRKLPRQVDSSEVEFSAASSRSR